MRGVWRGLSVWQQPDTLRVLRGAEEVGYRDSSVEVVVGVVVEERVSTCVADWYGSNIIDVRIRIHT